MNQDILFCTSLECDLERVVHECRPDRIFLLTDTHTHRHCLPLVQDFACLKNAVQITIEPTDAHKDLQTLSAVWAALQQGGATRHSLLLNLGGGLVADLGGFAASTF